MYRLNQDHHHRYVTDALHYVTSPTKTHKNQ
jgi:hypothetical protein